MKRKMKFNRHILLTVLIVAFLASVITVAAFAAAADTAQQFVAFVGYLENAEDINMQQLYLESIDAIWGTYVSEGGTSEDEAVAESYQKYLTIQAAVETKISVCNEFIDYVNAANSATGYPEKKEKLENAKALLDQIDMEYEGVSSAYSLYNSIVYQLQEPEETCQRYIEEAAAAAEAAKLGKTCYEVKQLISKAKVTKQLIKIQDYPGLSEADENIREAERYISDKALEAAPFVLAVRNISSASSIPEGVMAAYNALVGIDETADGVYAAISDLEKIESDYNAEVKEANDIANEAGSFMFILFPQK